MNPIIFEQLELQPDTHYFIYAGEIKALGLNKFYKEALMRHNGRDVDCISVIPDVMQNYPEGNLLVINKDAARICAGNDRKVCLRIAGDRFAAQINANRRFRNLIKELQTRQKVVPIWMFDSRPELELDSNGRILLMGPRPELARRFNSKVWQYRHLSQVVPMPDHAICRGEKALRNSVDEMGLRSGHQVFVTQEFGAAGVGSTIVCRMDDLESCLGKTDGCYVASCFIPHQHDPTVLAVVANEHDVYVAGVADMTIEGGNKFRGSSFPSRLPIQVQEVLVECTRRVGRTIGRLGYRGIFGCDFLVDEKKQVYFIEVNARKQGTTMEFCCTLEQVLPAGSPNLPELEYWAVTRNCFPQGTVEPPLGKSEIHWGTYNLKVEKTAHTHTHLPQMKSEWELFSQAVRERRSGHLILEHPGAGMQVLPGAFLARAVALGRGFDEMRTELDKAKKNIETSFEVQE